MILSRGSASLKNPDASPVMTVLTRDPPLAGFTVRVKVIGNEPLIVDARMVRPGSYAST